MNSTTITTEAALAPIESIALQQHEATIETGKDAFLKVGHALYEIKKGRLYRDLHSTFEVYCVERWGMSKQHAYRLIVAMTTVETIKEVTPGVTPPTSEKQVRPLAALPVEERAAAWQEASANGTPTAKQVEAVVDQRLHEDGRAEKEDGRPEVKNSDVRKKPARKRSDQGRLWKDVAIANCPRHKYGLHDWGGEDCEECHEPQPKGLDEILLHDVTSAGLLLANRLKDVLEAIRQPDKEDRLGHSFKVELHRRWIQSLEDAMDAIRSEAIPFPELKAVADPIDTALAETKLLAICAILDGDAVKGLGRAAK